MSTEISLQTFFFIPLNQHNESTYAGINRPIHERLKETAEKRIHIDIYATCTALPYLTHTPRKCRSVKKKKRVCVWMYRVMFQPANSAISAVSLTAITLTIADHANSPVQVRSLSHGGCQDPWKLPLSGPRLLITPPCSAPVIIHTA